MARTTTITTKSITPRGDGAFTITLNMVYADGETTLINQDYSLPYKQGQAWSILTFAFRDSMKADIKRYKESVVVSGSAGLSGLLTNLNSTVGV